MNPQTMFITGQDGKPVMINTADFDAETMTVHGAEAGDNTPPAPPVNPPDAGQPVIPVATVTGDVTPPAPPAAQTADEMFVGKKGKKFIVTNKAGEPIEAEGIEAAGYGTEAEAWSAIMARKTG